MSQSPGEKRYDSYDLIPSIANNDRLTIWDTSEVKLKNATTEQLRNYTLNILAGGTSNQYLRKNSNEDYDVSWVSSTGSGGDRVTVGTSGSGATYECDGTSDNLVIQEALDDLNTAGGGLLTILAGEYDIQDTITTYPNIIIEGEGAATVLDASNMAISGSTHRFIFTSTGDTGKTDFVFRDLQFKCFFTAGTDTTYATLPATSGIRVANARRVLVDNCYFQDCWNATTIGQNPATGDDTLGPLNIKQVIFSNNQCNTVLGGLQGYSEDRVIWANNHFEDVGDDACAFLGAENRDPASAKAVIVGNTFVNGRPINTNGVYGVGVFLKLDGGGHGKENIVDITMVGNIVDGAYIGAWFANASKIEAVANNIMNSYLSGLYLSGGTEDINIGYNRLYNNNTSGNGTHAGILGVNTSQLSIENNSIIGTSSGFKQAVNLEGTMSHIRVCNNLIKDCTGFAAVYCETFTNGKFDGNTVVNGANGIYIGGTDGSCCNNDFYGTFTSQKIATTSVTRIRIRNNGGVNPELRYAQGNVTGATTFNRTNGNVITATQTGSITAAVTAPITSGEKLTLILAQDATGGRTVTWPSNVKFPGGTAASHNTTASAVNIYEFTYDGTNWHGSALLDTTKYVASDGTTTMTGELTLSGTPTGANSAATKTYVDGRTLRSGDTFTGELKTTKNLDVTNQQTRGSTGENPTTIRTGGENTKALRLVGGAPWLPTDIATIEGWWKADSIYGLEDGAKVSTWLDSSGNGNHAAQSTTARQPLFVKNQINGYPVVNFTQASTQYLQYSFTPLLSSDFTLVMVDYRPSGSINTSYALGNNNLAGNASSTLQLGYSTSSVLRFRFGSPATTLDGTAGTANQYNITIARLEQAVGRNEYVNGSSAGSNTTTTAITAGDIGYIGRGDTGGYLQGSLAEVIVFSGALSTGDREKVEGYLAEKYGVRANLPGGHTYKSSLPTGTAQAVDYVEVINEAGTVKAKITKDGVVTASGFAPLSGITTYTASNVTTDRSYDANATTTDELADVLGTLIADLRALGLLL